MSWGRSILAQFLRAELHLQLQIVALQSFRRHVSRVFPDSSTEVVPKYLLSELHANPGARPNSDPGDDRIQGALSERWDLFLCHAWDDRSDAAKKLHHLLEVAGVTVWFSKKNVLLGSPLLREIDKGLAKSRAGLVLVTPAFLRRLESAGIAEKELSTLLARELLAPIVHNTTYDELREVSPVRGSRSGLSTGEDSMNETATKISELVSIDAY